MHFKSLYLTLFFCIIAFSGCSSNSGGDVAGNGVETTNGITGVATVSDTGTPVSQATVYLYKKSVHADSMVTLDSTVTDVDGRYTFPDLVPGEYEIFILSTDSSYSLRSSVTIEHQGQNIESIDTLVTPASISGTIGFNFDSLNLVAELKDSPFSTPVNADGSFLLQGISPGTYTLQVIATNRQGENPYVIYTDTLKLESGISTPLSISERYSTIEPVSFVFDDFEDGLNTTYSGSPWYTITDSADGGNSTISTPAFENLFIDTEGAKNTLLSSTVTFRFPNDSSLYVILAAPLAAPAGTGKNLNAVNVSSLDKVTFYEKGTGSFTARLCFASQLLEKARVCSATFGNANDTWSPHTKTFSLLENDPDNKYSVDQVLEWATDFYIYIIPKNDTAEIEFWMDEIKFNY